MRKPRLPKFMEMGLLPEEYAYLLLLPVFGVAWADGEMQAQEVKSALSSTNTFASLGVSEQHPIVEKWSKEPIDSEYLHSGLDFLRDLSVHEDFGEITISRLEDVVRVCHEVAKSAGGILGIAAVSRAEKRVISALEQNIEFLRKAR
jgi:hypothetical protein